MLLPMQRLLNPQISPTNPNQGSLSPEIIQALINSQQLPDQQSAEQQPSQALIEGLTKPLQSQQPIQSPLMQKLSPSQYDTPILEKYKEFLLNQQPPNYQDYKPSWFRRLMAGIEGNKGGPQAADYMLNAPYNRAMQAYDARAKQLGEGANVEERLVTNKRIINQNEQVNKIREESNQIRQQLGEAQNIIRQQQANTAQTRQDEINKFEYDRLAQNFALKQQELEQAQRKLDANQGNFQDQLELRRTQGEARNLLHEYELKLRDQAHADTLRETKRLNDERIQKMEADKAALTERLRQAGLPITETQTLTGPKGETQGTKTITRQKGNLNPRGNQTVGTVRMLSPDGKQEFDVPIDKVDDAISRGMRKK